MSLYPAALVCFVLLFAPCIVSAEESDVAEIERMAKAFEQARVTLDYDLAKEFALPEATSFGVNGRSANRLLAGIEYGARQKPNDNPYEPVRVLERQILVKSNVAIVNELLGATATVESGRKIVPRRRSMTWLKTGDGWKIAGTHSSDYKPWEKSITAYEEADKNKRIAPGGIVFVGSSSIRGWKTLHDDFLGVHVLGRGFGGSQLIDSIMYAHRIVMPYQPRAVAIYAGDNDVAAGKSAERVFADFKMLVETIHAADPNIRIGFIAIKPSMSRWRMWETMAAANRSVASFAADHDLVTYLDIATPMLGEDGKPKPELFARDGLHLSPAGYALWTSVVKPWAQQE